MSGHSKWATIKHKKGAADAARGKVFSRYAKELIVAARMGGGDPELNAKLRMLVTKARAANMPKDNIERAIKKGTGELEGAEIIEITYEGYLHGGVAVIVECLTDNKTRTVADIRFALSKSGGNLGESGSVSWNFHRKGVITVSTSAKTEDEMLELILNAGASDMTTEGEVYEILTEPSDLETVAEALQKAGLTLESNQVQMVPKDFIKIEDEDSARKVLKGIHMLEELDDVNNVYANFDMDDALMEAVSAGG